VQILDKQCELWWLSLVHHSEFIFWHVKRACSGHSAVSVHVTICGKCLAVTFRLYRLL